MIDALRAMSRGAGAAAPATAVPVFNEIFLDAVRERGRIFELGLMVRFKLRTKRLFEDAGKAPMMLLKGKLPLSAARVGGQGRAQGPVRPGRRGRRQVSYAFFPGCSLDGAAKDYHRSTLAVAAKLGLELPELKDWICCGSTAAHSSDPLLADALPAKSLSAAGGSTVAVACAACYSRLKTANHHIAGDAALRARVAHVVGRDYDGRTPVLHLLEILCRDIGLARIAAAVRRPLAGLKVACYYGCLLVASARDHQLRRPRESHADGPAPGSRRGDAASSGRTRPSAAARASPSPIRASCSN